MSNRGILCASLFALFVAGCVSTPPPAPAGVLVVDDASRVSGCRALGTVADNELDDLQKKAAKLGGNVALMTPQRTSKGGYFGLQDYMTADVYRCEAAQATPKS
jgi:hypothetical protein